MKSSRTPRIEVLDDEQVAMLERYNAEELAILQVYAHDIYGAEPTKELFARINEKLILENIKLSIEAGVNSLNALVHRILSGVSKKHVQDELNGWVEEYRQLEKKSEKELARLVATQKFNIIRSVLAGRANVDSVWGDEVDLRLILSGYITHPGEEQIYPAGKHIVLPPTAIVSEVSDVRNEMKGTVDTLKAVISRIPYSDTPTEILLPLCESQSHWKLQIFSVQNGRIVSSALVDSLTDHSNKSTIYAQKLVNKTNGDEDVKVNNIATKEQTNGHSCMDYVVKTIFGFVDTKTPAEAAIKQAETAKALRVAIIGKIFENHPNVRNSQNVEKVVKQKHKQESKVEVKDEAKVEPKVQPKAKSKPVLKKQPSVQDIAKEIFHTKYVADEDRVHEQLKEIAAAQDDKELRQIQIDFDAALAKRLEKSDDSAEAFKQAWQQTYTEMQRKFGLFQSKKRSSALPLQPITDNTKKVK